MACAWRGVAWAGRAGGLGLARGRPGGWPWPWPSLAWRVAWRENATTVALDSVRVALTADSAVNASRIPQGRVHCRVLPPGLGHAEEYARPIRDATLIDGARSSRCDPACPRPGGPGPGRLARRGAGILRPAGRLPTGLYRRRALLRRRPGQQHPVGAGRPGRRRHGMGAARRTRRGGADRTPAGAGPNRGSST